MSSAEPTADNMAVMVGKTGEKVDSGGNVHQGDTQPRLVGEDVYAIALEAAGELTLPLQGSSMGPAWRRATAVVVQSRARRAPRWGDVVVFQRNDRWYAHRLILRIGERCYAKGDARGDWDRPCVPRGDVLGVVVALVEDGRRRELARGSRSRALFELARALVVWPFLAMKS